jgi:hypothetical protein
LCRATEQGDTALHLFEAPGRFDILAARARGVDELHLGLNPRICAGRVRGACVCPGGPRCSRPLNRRLKRVVAAIRGGAADQRRGSSAQQQ